MKNKYIESFTFAALLLLSSNAYAQECKWTEQDVKNGTIAVDSVLNWTDTEQADWFNRHHPKVCNDNVGLSTPGYSISQDGGNKAIQCTGTPYSNPDCWEKKFARTDDGWRFVVGHTYLHPYPSLSVV